MTAGRGPTRPDTTSAEPLHPPKSQSLVFGVFLILSLFLRNVKVVPNTCGSANTTEEASQYSFGGGGRERRRERPHDRASDHEQSVWEREQERAGCVGPAGAPRREGWAHPHTQHTQPGMHALHPLLTHPRCAHSSLGTQGHPHTSTPERRSPAHCLHRTEDTAQRRARHILQVLQTQRSLGERSEGRPGRNTDPSSDPSLPFVLLGQGSGHSGTEGGMDRQRPGPLDSFCLELDSSVLAVGKWFSIESIIFFSFFKYIFVKVIPFCISGEICLSSFPIN